MRETEHSPDVTPLSDSPARRREKIEVLLVYPNASDVALANLGFQRVYALLNAIDGVRCDRLALPDDWTPNAQTPPPDALRSHDARRLPREFDMIAFSISFEPDYLNVATMLKYFGIPLERAARGPSHPLLLAGGSAVFINPEPLAEVVDVFCVGEAEEMAKEFFRVYAENDWDDPRSLLAQAARVPGVYVPRFYRPRYDGENQVGLDAAPEVPARVERRWARNPELLRTHSVFQNGDSAFKGMALMEITRGCIWACRFCTAGFIYRPPRLPDLDETYDALSETLRRQGKDAKTIGLVGPSVTDHPGLPALARRIVAEGKALSFSSLRMETLNDELVDLMVKSGQKTVTVAIDAPSERMRDVVNKSATDAFIVEKCRFLVEKGMLHLKIYSIVGLPQESDEDIDQFIELIGAVHRAYVEASGRRGKIGKLTIGLSPLVPKPGTPFQWHPMERVEVLRKRFLKIRKALGRLSNVKLGFGSPNEAYLQTYLSRGDRRLLGFFKAYLENGHDAKRALKEAAPRPERFVYRQYDRADCLPWDIIDHGYRADFLWQDYRRGLQARHTPICNTATCKICGLC